MSLRSSDRPSVDSILETQRADIGTHKSDLKRLGHKYDDVVAQLDEANIEIVERESGIENATGAIFDLRAQIDRLNGELAEAESSSTKAEAERDRIQLLFNDSTGAVQVLQRDQDVNRAEMERLRASETAKDNEIVRLRNELAASQQAAGSLRRQLDANTPFMREPPNLFRSGSEPVRGMHPPSNLPSYSAANVGTPMVGQQEDRGGGLGSDGSRGGYWTGAGSTYDIG